MDTPFGPRSESCFYVSGDVQVHPSAAIASGVLLQADSGSRLVVGPGVSVGAGAVIHAQGGVLSIAAQVTLGTGVLVLGQGRIGANACIGSKATILAGVAIAPGQMVAANAILGETFLLEASYRDENADANADSDGTVDADEADNSAARDRSNAASPAAGQSGETAPPVVTQIYGKVVVERLRRMMSSTSPPDLS